ncbi:cscB [Symbiodinium natans]|uniref:CscB protein n=1 Tax=Symbiodinium natans TaxID=878477 RepID=A0A812PFV3_9DINO|nr:cscB [Symbiodinium natans]
MAIPFWLPAALQFFSCAAVSCVLRHHLGYHGVWAAALSVASLTGLFCGSLFWGAVADYVGNIKGVLSVAHALAMICVPFNVMPSIASSYPLLACLTVLVSFLLAADTGLVDTICLAAADAQGDYGEMRSWSCIGCGLICVVVGAGLALTGPWMIYSTFVVLQVPLLIMLLFFLPSPRLSREVAQKREVKIMECLTGNKTSISEVFLYGLCLSLIEIFGPVYYIKFLGTSSFTFGAAVLIMCLAEIVVFRFIARALRDLHASWAWVRDACYALLALRCLGYCLVPASMPWAALALEVLHGFNFAAMWYITVKRADTLAPPGAQATMQSLTSGTYFFLSMGVGSMVWGHCLEAPPSGIGWQRSFQLCSFLTIAALAWNRCAKTPQPIDAPRADVPSDDLPLVEPPEQTPNPKP